MGGENLADEECKHCDIPLYTELVGDTGGQWGVNWWRRWNRWHSWAPGNLGGTCGPVPTCPLGYLGRLKMSGVVLLDKKEKTSAI